MELVIGFGAAGSDDGALVGGKGANLGKLTSAGFAVPAGYTLTTEAYRSFVKAAGLGPVVADYLDRFDYADLPGLDKLTAELRETIQAAPMPTEITEAILAAHQRLGADAFVAVRSSGTAEDLAEASFAGQHDTYLDILGPDAILAAVKQCWASLWTARATAYRNKNGIDQALVSIAVVIQTMVSSEVSGVMFTGNPLTAATDEIVVNASWGLGEAIVSGITSPDEFTISARTLKTKDRQLGAKQLQIVRAPSGQGVVERETSPADRARYCLTDNQITVLGQLGRSVTEYYGGIPQDMEWAIAGGQVFLLQSRPITGVRFSWDDQVDCWQPHLQEDVIWTRGWADAYNGPATPLFYSFRFRSYARGADRAMRIYGLTELAQKQWFKYHRGMPYYQGDLEAPQMIRHLPKAYRPQIAELMTPETREKTLAARWEFGGFLRSQTRGLIWDQWHNMVTFPRAWHRHVYGADVAYADGLSAAELQLLSDDELRRYTDEMLEYEAEYCRNIFQMMVPMAMGFGLFNDLLKRWYRGENPTIATDLMTGTPRRTATTAENFELWELARKVRANPTLRALFDANAGAAFFEEAAKDNGTSGWIAEYYAFRDKHSHRGHAERDIFHPRRSEDPRIDYNAITAMLSTGEGHDPAEVEERANRRREAAFADVMANIGRGPLGKAKAMFFARFYQELIDGLMLRDDERHWVDRVTMSIKRCFLEFGRRLTERGVFEAKDDIFFLTVEENSDLLRGSCTLALTRAKIAGRRANFMEAVTRAVQRPAHLQHNKPLDLTSGEVDDSSGVLRGAGTSSGNFTGRARIIRQQENIGQVKQGEILVTEATDPGWTPVFMVISAVVVETGGMLAHAACLAREYGFPAVQLAGAMSRIPDGALITVDGAAGTVTIVEEETQ
jgi:pyruvate,water dikinase